MRALIISIMLLLTLGACTKSASQTAPKPKGLPGAWERIDGPPTDPFSRPVLEFLENGKWRLHQAGASESGDYSVDGKTVKFEGGRYNLGGWKQEYAIKGDELTITSTLALPTAPKGAPPLVDVSTWRFIVAPTFVPTEMAGGLAAPAALPEIAVQALMLARERNPSVDVRKVDVEQYLPGAFKLDFYMMAPDRSGVVVTMDPYHIRVKEFAQAYWGDHALPVAFIDLPKATEIAVANGLVGDMTKADLGNWSGKGAYWRVFSHAGAVTVNAVNGEVMKGDVTGYVEQYNADWDRALKLLAEAIKKSQPAPKEQSCGPMYHKSLWGCKSSQEYVSCVANGGSYCSHLLD
ncbi:MAG TPA: hypothetical protein PLV61_14760 [Parvularculaceae bacterium]|nr:hypothetical protein [Caulobacterales bacterium]HPE32449.1 hypothetical protein [Parvularculaceae bacterium]